jgi:Fe-S cluster assembly iron-binding protein IscA
MEVRMITVTDSAKKELDAYFEGNPPQSIRVFLSGGG